MKKRIIIASTIIILMLSTFKVKAATFKDNQVVQAIKSWTIHFNQEVSLDDLSKQSITVVDSNGTKADITLSSKDDNKTIVVNPPAAGYKAGSTYKLIIGSKVHSKQNKNISQEIAMSFSIEKSNEDDVVTFKDANLEKVVRDDINKPTGVLYKKDVEEIKVLEATNKKIVYLDGIENLTNLEYANLAMNSISDISKLSSLVNLQTLALQSDELSDISPLKSLTNLEDLDLSGNKISDISILKGLHKLRELQLGHNPITNIEAVKDLTNLQGLHLNDNEIEDINSIENLSNLSYLDITDNPIKDVSVLTKLNNLEYLNFSCNNLYSMDCLKQMKGLKGINAYYMSDLNKFFTVYDKANEIIKTIIKPEMSDLEKEKAIHDYIVLNAKYDYDNYSKNTMSEDDYSPYGILIKGTGVCNSYAYATKLLLNMVGIKSIVVDGNAGTEYHAWNIVQIGGKNYQLDTTWDDPTPDEAGYVSYNYFNISDKELSKDHQWSSNYPKCTGSLSKNGVSGDTVITFKDYNFEQAVRKIVNRPDGNILMDDIKNITDIQYYPADVSKKIKDLSGIENFENLEYLQLDGNCIENVEPLKDIKTLKVLNLVDNKISNIDALSNLTELDSLSLSGNNILSIDALSKLNNLSSLELGKTKISNINALSKLSKLTYLDLENNAISNIDSLSNMTNLIGLSIANNNISDISALGNLRNVGRLCLECNNINNVDALKNLTNLDSLYLSGNPINQKDIDELKKVLINCNISY